MRRADRPDRKSTRLNSSHLGISYAVFCLKKKSCFVPRYLSVVWTDGWPSSNWIWSSSPPAARHNFAQVRRQSWGAIPFFFNDTATTEIYTLSLHDALPI